MIEKAKLKDLENKSYFFVRDFSNANWHANINNKFDLIISGFSIHHIDNEQKKRLYKDIYKLLKPKGIFLNLEHVSSPTNGLEELFNDLFLDGMMDTFVIDDQIRNCYSSLIPYFGKDKVIPESILESKFKELLFNIFAHPENKHILAYIMRIVDRYQTPIWEIMEANYMYDLKIQDFANISNSSLSAFKRDFKEYYKVSPAKWITERRLKLAKSLLETIRKSISEVGFDSRFNNASHFSKVFKERFHVSPSEAQKS